MEYNIKIADMQNGDKVEGFYILKTANSRASSTGKPYLAATLSDISGTIEIRVWDYSGPISTLNEGSVVKIRGIVSEYKGTPQVTVELIRLAESTDTYNLEALVPAAPIDREAAWAELKSIVDGLDDPSYRNICWWMLNWYGEKVKRIPAGKSVHHAFVGGLLMHTLNMVRAADKMASLYGDVIDRNLLIAGTVLHDFVKCDEFEVSPLGLVTDYSMKGKLLGHLVMGAQMVARAAAEVSAPEEKAILLQHMMLSHHGQPDAGAAVRPACAESELLHLIDLMDSRMEIYREALDGVRPGEFTQKIFALDKSVYKHY